MSQSSRAFASLASAWHALSPRLPTFVAVLVMAVLWSDGARAEDDKARKTASCQDCGIVRSIREIRTERSVSRPDVYTTSPQYLDTRPNDPPRIGPAFSLSWGPGRETESRIGALGTPQMQQRYTEISYEIIVRFDDGRFGLLEQQDTGDVRVGDRVQVVDRKVERLKQ